MTDGSLQQQYGSYKKRLEMAKVVGLHKEVAKKDLTAVLNDLSKDLEFLHSGISCLLCISHQLMQNYFRDNQV